MEAAKRAVAEFTSRRGHKTDVEEIVRPAVTLETVKPTRHEIFTHAVDKEVHQHHYHTTVQPISHREVLPEKHTHNLLAVDKRDHTHKTREHNEKIKAAHAKEVAFFTDHSETQPTTHTQAHLPAVIGEHVHHHVHEVVQPIIFKETHVPERVHTTVPIHEIHHHEPVHHRMSELAMQNFEDFVAGQNAGHTTMREEYDGPPRSYNTKLNIDPAKYRRKPSPINTRATRNSTTTPPLSPASGASSPSMPSTPKNNTAAEPGFRHSEDSANDFSLPSSPATKTPIKTQSIRADQNRGPQQLRM